MNDSKYRFTLYLITVVILATIGIQTYWNYKNYQSNKTQLLADVQVSLDKAVEDYYTEIAQKTTLGLKIDDDVKGVFKEDGVLDKIAKNIDENNSSFVGIDSMEVSQFEGVTIFRGVAADSLMKDNSSVGKAWKDDALTQRFDRIKSNTDSSKQADFEMLTSKVIISISNDTLNLNTVDSLITTDLSRKQMLMDFFLEYEAPENKSAFRKDKIIKYDKENNLSESYLIATSQSTFLSKGSKIRMNFSDESRLVFNRSWSGILISTVLVLSVISSLFYLLKIIKTQKQLSEVKNDLISNITHEFKTPIATIGVALESLQNFNAIEDKDKTKTYLNMSNEQLTKLNTMVEKLLETATLDSDNLELNKERYNLSEVVEAILEKHKLQNHKTIASHIDDSVYATVDIFHMENAINNLVDNAFKYGGDHINITLKAESSKIELVVSDNGTTLTKANKDRIFEKFYRIPKGNTHDIKGFGIGLYYTKTIIEKHKGTIELELGKAETSFKITLPYA